MMFNSIRIRLTMWYLSVLALIIVAFAIAAYLLMADNLDQAVNRDLAEMGKNVEAELVQEAGDLAKEIRQREEGDATADQEETPTLEEAIDEEIRDLNFGGYWYSVIGPEGNDIVSTATDPGLRESLSRISSNITFLDIAGQEEEFRVHQMPLDLDGRRFRLLVATSLRNRSEFLTGLRQIFFFAVPVALLLAGAGGYFLARRSLAPVVLMSREAEKIGMTNLNARLPVRNRDDELGGLAKVFNSLLGRLEGSFKQQRRFIADASHELRTPLTIIRTESEVALSNKERPNAEYLESLAIIHNESKRLSSIVEDLFLLAKQDSRQFEPNFEDVLIDEIVMDSIRSVRSLAEQSNIGMVVTKLPEMPVSADSELMHRLFLNLLDNAIKYNKNGGSVTIEADRSDGVYTVTIADTGQGIAEELRPRIFERFFRADESRGHEDKKFSGGAGLGLPIAAWIAEIHGGKLFLESSDAHGSIFRIELPFTE